MGGGEAPGRHHGGEMIEPDDRMTESGQDAFAERRRHTPTHEVVREGGLGQAYKCGNREKQAADDAHRSLSARAKLSLPAEA